MAKIKGGKLYLRCFAFEVKPGLWFANCIDLKVSVEAPNMKSAKCDLEDAIHGYIETVLDTDDKESIPRLLNRKSPPKFFVYYYIIAGLLFIHAAKERLIKFDCKETVPQAVGV